MYVINSIQELKQLKPAEKFVVIEYGNCKQYAFACAHPLQKKLAVAIPTSNHASAETFSDTDFKQGKEKTKVLLAGEYNSKEVGEWMQRQLQYEIASIQEIYIDKPDFKAK